MPSMNRTTKYIPRFQRSVIRGTGRGTLGISLLNEASRVTTVGEVAIAGSNAQALDNEGGRFDGPIFG